jgi:hypothetical protein
MDGTEVVIRGLIDKLIEDHLTDVDLDSSHKIFESFKVTGAIRNDRRDAVFGYVVGAVFTEFGKFFKDIFKRYRNVEEMNIAVDVFNNRLLRIKSRIDETFT